MIYFFVGLIFVGWLVPNHYFPWLAGWSDAASITGLVLFSTYVFLGSKFKPQLSLLWIVFFGAVLTVPWLQWFSGHLYFLGDAVMVSLYAAYALLAILLGKDLGRRGDASSLSGMTALTSACALSAIASTGIALAQWTDAISLGIYAAELPFGARPFANVGQPNHLNTLCFMGICAVCWLYEQQRIGKAGWLWGVVFLAVGMLLSQSRTGWLQMVFLMGWGAIQYLRMRNRISWLRLLVLGGIFVAGIFLWQPLNEFLLLDAGRDLSSQMKPGTRVAYWLTMLDAVLREPWWGYGWQQIGAAQQNVAIDHPPLFEYFEHSHNLVLDLILWNGIPLGIFLSALLAFWFFSSMRNYSDPATGWILAAVVGLGIHALLEFPLEYAYFLIPAGLLIGAIDANMPVHRMRWIPTPRSVAAVSTLLVGSISLMVASEWLAAEENYRSLRFESARIGQTETSSQAPDFQLLTQLSAFLHFARTEATPDMAPEQVAWMRQVSWRFGYPPAMFRYALATGLQGNASEAEITLKRICHMHGAQRCSEAQEGWDLLQQRFPQLKNISGP